MEKHIECLITEIGARLGCAEFALDANNRAIVSCNDLLVQISVVKETQLRLSAWIGTMPDDDEQGIVAVALLSANHFFTLTNDATLALDPMTKDIWLHQNLSIAGCNADYAFNAMERFVETAADWFDRLNPLETEPVYAEHPGVPPTFA